MKSRHQNLEDIFSLHQQQLCIIQTNQYINSFSFCNSRHLINNKQLEFGELDVSHGKTEDKQGAFVVIPPPSEGLFFINL